ncbi:unnamed protein product, partial [Scytosiphon promiscuus]
ARHDAPQHAPAVSRRVGDTCGSAEQRRSEEAARVFTVESTRGQRRRFATNCHLGGQGHGGLHRVRGAIASAQAVQRHAASALETAALAVPVDAGAAADALRARGGGAPREAVAAAGGVARGRGRLRQRRGWADRAPGTPGAHPPFEPVLLLEDLAIIGRHHRNGKGGARIDHGGQQTPHRSKRRLHRTAPGSAAATATTVAAAAGGPWIVVAPLGVGFDSRRPKRLRRRRRGRRQLRRGGGRRRHRQENQKPVRAATGVAAAPAGAAGANLVLRLDRLFREQDHLQREL